jgi:hypothetical protein
MKIKSKLLYLTITLIIFCLSLVFANSGAAEMGMEHGSGHGMTMHHQHVMLNHALIMALEGSNMTMLGQMGMAPGVDEVSVKHGAMMMKDGKALMDQTMSGDAMKKMHAEGKTPTDDPVMGYTHKLAEAQTKVMDLLSKMSSASHAGHGMTMHHQHIMLNHALSMALEGSNMVMLGQMGMAPGVDEMTVHHGEMMMKDAKDLWNEIMSGDTMKKMHAEGKSPKDDPTMAYTHELAEAQLKVMDLLSKMPAMTK